MYSYNFNDKIIISNRVFNFKKQLNEYFSGKLGEFEIKVIRLQNGLYRQRNSYMYRIAVPYSILNIKQLYLISYIIYKYDKRYLHFTTRTNIQINWINIFILSNILEKMYLFNIHSIQTSGNCVRNIISDFIFNKINIKYWSELIRQWFSINSEFLFLPRKFKIAILCNKIDNIYIKIHDLGIFFKKNYSNNLIINILVGGGLGRTPIIGFYIYKNIHWKKFLIYCNSILKIYNIYGFRENIYKSRIKILLKSINLFKFKFLINNEFYYYCNEYFILSEKEVNKFLFIKINNFQKLNYIKFFKKIKFNFFFLNWIKFSIKIYKNYFYFILPVKGFGLSSGDLFDIQIKIICFFFKKKFINNFIINNRQNLVINSFFLIDLYFIYNLFKKILYNIYDINLITDLVCCPGFDYCNLANTKSINLYNYIRVLIFDFNTFLNLREFSINISGCINSCSHYHISNIGFLGINKNNQEYYQIYLGGNFLPYKNLKFSKVLGPSISEKDSLLLLNKILNFYLINNKINEDFIDFYNRVDFFIFKNLLFN